MDDKKYSIMHIGEEVETNEGYLCIVIAGGSRKNYCTVSLDGNEFEVQYSAFKTGVVKNRFHPYSNHPGYLGNFSGATHKEKAFTVWQNMMNRCYSEKDRSRFPTYNGVTVIEEWWNFSNFREWFKKAHVKGFELDKDLIGNGSLYSPSTCLFIPKSLNNFLRSAHTFNGSESIGAYWDPKRKKWLSQIRYNNKRFHLGRYKTKQKAEKAYNKKRSEIVNSIKKEMFNVLPKEAVDKIR